MHKSFNMKGVEDLGKSLMIARKFLPHGLHVLQGELLVSKAA